MSSARGGDAANGARGDPAAAAGDTSVDLEAGGRASGAAREREVAAGAGDTSVDLEVAGARGADPLVTASLDVVLPLPPTPLVVPGSASASSLDLPLVRAASPGATPDVRSTKPMTTVLPLPAPPGDRAGAAGGPGSDVRRADVASDAGAADAPASAPGSDLRRVGASSGARAPDGGAPTAPAAEARRVGASSGARAPDGGAPTSPAAEARRVGASSGARPPGAPPPATPALPAAEVRRVGASSGARAPNAPAIESPRGEAPAPTRAVPAVEPRRPDGARRPGEPATPRGVDSQAETNADGRRAETESFDAAEASSADAPPRSVQVTIRPPADEGLATAIPGLRLGAELGRGAQGIVYRAARVAPSPPGPDVAVKLLRPEASDEEVARFERALEAMDALRDVPGVVQVIARGRTPLGQPWFSMELVKGPSLRAAIADGLLPPRALAALVVDAARAVHGAHDRGIVHRDLKPENVLIDALPDGAFAGRVADFGLARDLHAGATASVDAAGTLAYMAPEQITGGEVTRRTDIHALGAILYEVITGAPPFRRPTHAAIARAIVHEAPRAPATFWSGLPAAFGPIALRALAKDPAERPQTAALLASHIERALAGESLHDLEAPAASAPRGPGPLRRALDALRERSRFLRGLALGVVLGTGLGWLAGVTGWAPAALERRPEPPPAPVKRRR